MKPLTAGGPLRSVPLRRRLFAVAAASILPLAIISGLGLYAIVRDQQAEAEQRPLEVTRLIATAIDAELNRSIDVLQALAQSPLLDNGDLAAFERQAARILPVVPGWDAINLATPSGAVIARIPALPQPFTASPALTEARSLSELIRTGQPRIGHLGRGPSGGWGIPLRVPVIRDGVLKYSLNAIVQPEMIRRVISDRGTPAGWTTTVIDGNGRRLARSQRHDETVGEPPSPTLARLLAERPEAEGIGISTMVEGDRAYSAFVRLDSGWVVATGIPTADMHLHMRRATALYGGGLLLSLLLALVAALYMARRINGPMRALRGAAQAIGAGAVPAPLQSEITEIQEVGSALVAAASARLQSEQERDQLVSRLELTREELTQQVADLEQLQQLNQRLLELATLEEQLTAILAAVCELHGTDHGVIALSRADGTLALAAAQGFSSESLAELRTLAAQAAGAADRRRVTVADIDADPHFAVLRPLAHREGFCAFHSAPLRSSGGQVVGTLSTQLRTPRLPTAREVRLVDLCAGLAAVIIERARARDAAGASEQRLHVALDSSTIPFCVLTPVRRDDGTLDDFRCDFANQTAAVTLRRPVSRLIGTRLGDVLAGRFPAALATLAEVIECGQAREREFEGEGSAAGIWYHLVATPFQQSVAVWFNDISERKRQQQTLQEADRRKDEFIATLAHELRNPLAPIRQAAAIIGTPGASEAQKQRSSAIIERQVNHMVLLLEDLLDVSRITLGKLTLRKESIDLLAVIDSALESARPALAERSHTVTTALPAGPLWIEADPLRLEQILANLLANAAKYTEPGGTIHIAAQIEPAVPGSQRRDGVAISVQDNGIGIAPDDLRRIFQMFTQLQSGAGHTSGLGIGLALAQGLAQLHGGEIVPASAGRGKGSSFTLRLPIDLQAAAPEDPVAAVPEPASAHRRVLIADDNRDIAETMAELLELEGHTIALAFAGTEALERYREFQPDVALLDIGMPGMRGEEVARAIRALPGGDAVTLIAITGWGQERDKAATASAGFDHHLTKPADVTTLLDLVAAAPARSVARSAPADAH